MSEERKQRHEDMMHEELDGQLSDEMARRLVEVLGRDQAAAQEYNRLRRIDTILKRAPHQRAPARLAATIMARLAERVRAQTELSALAPETQRMMMLSFSAVTMALMPMMEAASWLVLNAQRDPQLLGDVVGEIISLMSLVTDALIQLLDDAEGLAREDPNVATATLALTPYLLSSILDYLEDLPLEQ